MLKILGHNAFWFQGAPFEPDVPGPADAAVLARLCAIYRAFAPDVLCLQEIQDEATFRAVAEALGMKGVWCPGGELPQYGGAVLWRKGGRPVADSRRCEPALQRMWQVVEVPVDGRRLTIGNVHLPSDRQFRPESGEARRRLDLAALIGEGAPAPSILAGDFNDPPGGPVDADLADAGYRDVAVLTGKGDVPTSLGGGRGDWLRARADFGEAALGYGVIAAIAHGEDRQLSDHFPLWMTLEFDVEG